MKLSQLEALIAIADGHGIAGAAEKLNVSHPAVTKSLSSLEHHLGVELLDRSEYRLKLNIYGEKLLQRARAISAETIKATEEIKLMRDLQEQVIYINGAPGVVPKLIPLALQRARSTMPNLSIEFCGQLSTGPKIMYADLAKGIYDLLIYPVEADHEIDDFWHEHLLSVKMIVMASHNHPATKLKKPNLADLNQYDWLYPSKRGIPYRVIRQAFIEANTASPKSILALPMREMFFSFLRNPKGQYLAFIPYHPAIAHNELSEFPIIDVDMPEYGWPLHLIRRKSTVPSKGMLEFIDAFKEIVKESVVT